MDMLQTTLPEKKDSDKAAEWRKWMDRIEARKKVFKDGWWVQAANAERMYNIPANSKPDDIPFNVLYANTEVLLPSMYSASPRPDVAMRNKMAQDPIARATEAYLNPFIDMNVPGRETFDDSMEGATLSALVPGMGFVRLRAYPEEVCPIRTEAGTYRELLWGKAQRWSRVPWVAFIHTMVKEDIVKQFALDEEAAKKVKVETQSEADSAQERKEPTIYVYELWIKATKQIVWLCDGYEDLVLGLDEDALRLPGFYPTPGPLTLVKKPGSLDPTPIFEFYRNQAEELNRVSVRLNKVLHAIRVRGAYNNLLGNEIKKILDDTETENALVPSQNAMDMQGKGFDGQIWLLPIEQLIQVLKELYGARIQIMSVIQQITGLSDIVRGSTVASETATAQDLKNKWGTIRLRRMQRIVQFYVRDLLRLSVNMAANTMSEEQWKQVTQLPIPLAAEKQAAILQLQAAAQQEMMAQQQAQVVAQAAQAQGLPPPPPPQPTPPDPQLIKTAQSPSWQEIITTLQNDGGRSYTIDIETASTIDTDATADREEVTDFMGAIAQLFTGLAPLVGLGPSGMQVAKELLIAVCSKFKFGREVKESIEKLQAPPPGQSDPKVQAEMAKMQAEQAQMQEEHQLKMQLEKEKADMEREQMQMKKEEMLLDHQIKMAELQAKVDMMPEELAMQREQHAMKKDLLREQTTQKIRQAKSTPKPKANSGGD